MPAHSHGRGTQDITGGISLPYGNMGDFYSGWDCFYLKNKAKRYSRAADNNTGYNDAFFQASKKWSGTSESKGSGTAHGHSWTGTQVTINHMNPYSVAYCFKRIN